MNTHHDDRRGNTLIEVSISTLLVGLLMLGALMSVGNIGKTWASASKQNDGQQLAEQLLNEIMSQYYCSPTDSTYSTWGPESGETSRATFNDMDDYVGWEENPVADASGTALPGYTGWSRKVTISKINPSGYVAIPKQTPDTGLRIATVVVTSPSGQTIQLQAYRSNVAGSLQPVSANATTVSWVGMSLQLGSNNASSAGVNLVNHPEDQ